MKGHSNFYISPPEEEGTLHFRTLEISGCQLLGDGEALHELAGYERPLQEDGGAHDAAMV
jgi:hypothetical protein